MSRPNARYRYAVLVIGFALMLCLGISCTKQEAAASSTPALSGLKGHFTAMKNVPIDIIVYGRDQELVEADVAACQAEVERLELILNRHRPESTLAKLNNAEIGTAIPVDQELIEVIQVSAQIYELTGGLFDPTVTPLITLWKQAAEDQKIPAEEAIAEARALVGFDAIVIEGDSIKRLKPVTVDLGAVAKGYIVDKLIAVLKNRGAETGIVNAGGDLSVFGSKPGGFAIGIQDPADRSTILHKAVITSGSVVTSGSYERFSEIEGKRFSHIINPLTGKPVENDLISVSVYSDSAALADGLATGIFVLGFEAGKQLIENDTALGGYLVNREGQAWEQVIE